MGYSNVTPKMAASAKEYRQKHPKIDSVAAYKARVVVNEAKRRRDSGGIVGTWK